MSNLAVIIVNYNRGDLLKECIDSLPSCWDIVVVDNASTDVASKELAEGFKRGIWLQQSENLGFGRACNLGANHTTCDYLLFLNPDTYLLPESQFCPEMLFSEVPGASAFGFKHLDWHGDYQLSYGWYPRLSSEVFRKVLQGCFDYPIKPVVELTHKLFNKRQEISWVAGSSLLVKREYFWQVDGFDENIFLFFEDIDLCLRLGIEVGPVIYEPKIVIKHWRGASANINREVSRTHYRQSQIYFWEKYHGAFQAKLLKQLLIRLKRY
ncbi:MAG: glycosyltransferase family 2 protein [Myxococcota bacterium]|nr:glycosyltransferase family 2 protein [Myxococcota bacterium]